MSNPYSSPNDQIHVQPNPRCEGLRLDPKGFKGVVKKMAIRMVMMSFIVTGVVFFLFKQRNETLEPIFLAFLPFLFGLSFLLSLYWAKKVWQSFRIVPEADRITRIQLGLPETTILISEIQKVIEFDGGLVIEGLKRKKILIPVTLIDYRSLRDQFLDHFPSEHLKEKKWTRTFGLLLSMAAFLGLFAIVFTNAKPIIVAPAAFCLAIVMIVCFVLIQKNKDIDQNVKMLSFVFLFPTTGFLFRGIAALIQLFGKG